MKKLILSLLLICNVANATVEEDARDYKLLSDKLKQKIELQNQEINILEQRLNNYIVQSNTLAKEIGSKQTTEGLYRFAYFILGVAVTGYIASNVNR